MKVELDLPDKPEVHAIAGIINKEPEFVVGALIKIWAWFDKHTTDGNAFGVTFALPDKLVGVTGFAEAMLFVGWLEQKDKYLSMPKFDRHTSDSAKNRASTAKRVNKSRANKDNKLFEKCNDNNVTKTLPREEKIREYIIKGSRLPVDWVLPDEYIFEARKINNNLSEKQIRFIADGFKDYWIAKTGKEAIKLDWMATWRNWLRNQKTPIENRNNQPTQTGLVL